MNVANVPMQAASPAPVPDAIEMNQAAQEPERRAEKLESITVTGSSIGRVDMETASPKVVIQRARINNRYSKSTVVQTGAGEPGWQLGNRYQLNWSGPVLADQSVRLLIASPWLVRLLRVVLVAVLGVLLWQLLRKRSGGGVLLSRYAKAGSVLLLVLFPCVVQAQGFPSDTLLQDLKARLAEPPRCAPICASIANALVSADGDGLRVAMDVHAQTRVSVAIPVDEKSLVLEAISIDGVADAKLANVNGATSVAVDRGVHRVEIRYAVSSDRVELAFPEQPRRIRFEGSDWVSSGIADDLMLTETLSLTRSREAGDAVAENVEQRFPPYVRVHRTINLDLDWSIDGTVERLAPDTGGFTVNMAMLAGEHVQTPGLKVQDGKLLRSGIELQPGGPGSRHPSRSLAHCGGSDLARRILRTAGDSESFRQQPARLPRIRVPSLAGRNADDEGAEAKPVDGCHSCHRFLEPGKRHWTALANPQPDHGHAREPGG